MSLKIRNVEIYNWLRHEAIWKDWEFRLKKTEGAANLVTNLIHQPPASGVTVVLLLGLATNLIDKGFFSPFFLWLRLLMLRETEGRKSEWLAIFQKITFCQINNLRNFTAIKNWHISAVFQPSKRSLSRYVSQSQQGKQVLRCHCRKLSGKRTGSTSNGIYYSLLKCK